MPSQIRCRTITFENGNRARLAEVPLNADPSSIISALSIGIPKAVLSLSGGAKNLPAHHRHQLHALIAEGVARTAAEEGILIVDGGTKSGVAEILGEALSVIDRTAPVVGVVPKGEVTYPGAPVSDAVPLEPNHSHFVLVDANEWGTEAPCMFALIAALSQDAPSVAVVVNGGKGTCLEVRFDVAQGRGIILIRGSGRVADTIAEALERRMSHSDDPLIAKIVDSGRIALFDIHQPPENLALLIRRHLGLA